MIDVAMGDKKIFQAAQINTCQKAGLPLRSRRTGIEKRQTGCQFRTVEVNCSNHVGGLYGMLLH
jgi:hypothetical protein